MLEELDKDNVLMFTSKGLLRLVFALVLLLLSLLAGILLDVLVVRHQSVFIMVLIIALIVIREV